MNPLTSAHGGGIPRGTPPQFSHHRGGGPSSSKGGGPSSNRDARSGSAPANSHEPMPFFQALVLASTLPCSANSRTRLSSQGPTFWPSMPNHQGPLSGSGPSSSSGHLTPHSLANQQGVKNPSPVGVCFVRPQGIRRLAFVGERIQAELSMRSVQGPSWRTRCSSRRPSRQRR
jgi:hypothetical protein